MKEPSGKSPKNEPTHQTDTGYEDSSAISREELLEQILTGSAGVAVLGMLVHAMSGDLAGSIAYGIVLIVCFVLKKLKQWPFYLRAVSFLALLYLFTLSSLFIPGIWSGGLLLLAILPPLAILLISNQAGIAMVVLSALNWLGAGFVSRSPEIFYSAFPWQEVTSSGSSNKVFLGWAYTGVVILWIMVVMIQVLIQFRKTQEYLATVTRQKQDLQDTRTELIHRTQQLDYERYLLHILMDTISERIIFKDLSGCYTRVSQISAQQFGLPADQVIGKTDIDFFSTAYAQQMQNEEKEVLEGGRPIIDRVARESWRDGRPDTWSIISRLPLKGEDGRTVGWFGTARDITEIKRAQEADRHHAQQLSAVAEVGRAVTSNLDLQSLLRVLVELLEQSFDYYGVNVWMLTDAADAVQLKAGLDPQREDLSQLELQLPMQAENNITQACRTGLHQLTGNLDKPPGIPLSDKFPEARSQLLLPLRIADKIIGVLEILDQRLNAFQEEDVILLRSLADQVTIAIRNASLYEGERTRRKLAETLYQVGQALSTTLDLAEVLDLILHQLSEIVPADRAVLMLLEGEELEVVAAREVWPASPVPQLRLQLKENSVFEQVCRLQKPLAISDITQREDWKQLSGLEQARSWLGIPLIRSNETTGMLALSRETLEPYSISEVTLAQTFAGQAAVALENARLYDNLARFNQKLEEMVQKRTEELRKAYDQLERLDHTKSDFIKVTSHELRTPLTVLRGYGQMLLEDPTINQNPALAQLIDGMYSGALRLHEIVNSMLDIAKIDSRSLDLSPEPLSMAFLIKNVAGNFEIALIQRKLTLKVEDMNSLPRIEADAGALHKVFYQLLSNAIKYTPDGGQIVISGFALPPDVEFPEGAVEIIVQDTGIGIDPNSYELIFSKFYQSGEVALHSSSRTKFKGGGPGLGLPIARGIVLAHQGKLWVESPGHNEQTCPGSRFYIVLPVRQKAPAGIQS